MKDEAGSDVSSKLTIDEVLHLLRPKVERGIGMPKDLKDSPWLVPGESEEIEGINSVLRESLHVQSSTIPKSEDFKEFILSNSSLAVSGLLRHYLLSIPSLKASCPTITFGVLLWDKNARTGPEDYEGTPHIWLDVKGSPIDNAYVSLPQGQEYLYKVRRSESYLYQSPWQTNIKLFLGEDVEKTTKHNLKVYKNYYNPENIEKYLVFALRGADLNPGVRMYDILMTYFIKNTFGVAVPDLTQIWNSKCWNCGKFEEGLKSCVECKFARYCGVECQKKEWKMHKILHKELEFTKEILNNLEVEENELKNAKLEILKTMSNNASS